MIDGYSSTLSFTVPRPPVPKERPRVFAGRGTTPQRTRDYEIDVRAYATAARLKHDAERRQNCRTWPLNAEAYEVTIRVCREPKARGDADNYVKAILDGCQGALFANDCRVTRLVCEIHADAERPRVEVEITARGEDRPPRARAGASGAAQGPGGSRPRARAAR